MGEQKNSTIFNLIRSSLFLLLICFCVTFYAQKQYNQEFQIQGDNDILTFKRKAADRYYSFGLHIDYRKMINEETKLFTFSFKHIKDLKKVIVNWHAGIEGYTSDQNRDEQINGVFVAFDRPYAGWSFVGNRITAVNNKTLYYVQFTLGILGPFSGAEKLQDNFHNLINNPKLEEWENQVQNEIAGNLGFGINYPIYRSKRFDIHSESMLSLGTQATFLKQGFIGRVGLFNAIENTSFYRTNLTNEDSPAKNELYLDFGAHGVFWGYKATIQGRVFGENINMNTDGLHRFNVDVLAGINYARDKLTIFYKHHLITAETKRGRHFYYGSIGLIFKF